MSSSDAAAEAEQQPKGGSKKADSRSRQGDQILRSSKATDKTGFPRALWRVWVVAIGTMGHGWDALGMAV